MKLNLRAYGLTALALLAVCSVGLARDLDQDEALRLRQQGVILPLEQLLQQALQERGIRFMLPAQTEAMLDDGAGRVRAERIQ